MEQVFATKDFDPLFFLKLAQADAAGRGLLGIFEMFAAEMLLLDLADKMLSSISLDSVNE